MNGWKRQVREQAFRQVLLIVYEARFGAMPNDLRETLRRIHGDNALLDLIAILVARAHEEATAAMHQDANAG